MSITTEWRKLADTYGLPAKQYAEALRAAADRLDAAEARAEKAEAELARVTAEAAVMREALEHFAAEDSWSDDGIHFMLDGSRDDGHMAREALASTSAGAGLLKRLDAAEAVIKLAPQQGYCHVESSDGYHGTSHADWCLAYQAALEAWKRARGET